MIGEATESRRHSSRNPPKNRSVRSHLPHVRMSACPHPVPRGYEGATS